MESSLSTIKKPKGCSGICCSDFYRIESLDTVPMPTLTTQSHALFTRTKLNYLYQSLVNGTILDDTAKLATMLIEASLPFFHSTLFGQIREMDEDDSFTGELQHEIYYERMYTAEQPEALTTDQQDMTRTRLEELAEYIRYERMPGYVTESDRDGSGETEEGLRVGDSFWKGRTSTIRLSADFEANLIRNQDVTYSDRVSYHWHAFYLAITLVHEVAHAVVAARRPKVVGNLFYEGSDVAEPGYEWEFRTFGGIMCRKKLHHHEIDGSFPIPKFYDIKNTVCNLKGMICKTQWPDDGRLNGYVDNNHQIGIRSTAIIPPRSSHWNVEFSDIHRLFQQTFWDQSSFKRQKALWTEQKTGLWNGTGYIEIPDNYSVTGRGLVYDARYGVDNLFDSKSDHEEVDDMEVDEEEDYRGQIDREMLDDDPTLQESLRILKRDYEEDVDMS